MSVTQYGRGATQLIKNVLSDEFRQHDLPLFHPDGLPIGFLTGSIAEAMIKGEDEDVLRVRIRQELLKHGWTLHTQ